jgi:glycosyltransferase involved in cell wall biosynthesis
MRVALLSRAIFPLHGYGGLERHVAALEKYLRREGCAVTLYTTPPAPASDANEGREGTVFVPYRMVPWPRRKGFTILDRDTNYLVWSVRAARRLLSEGRTDIVQADGGAGFGYALARDARSAPLVLHPHGMEEFESPGAKRALYLPLRAATRFAARRAARVLCPDASMRRNVLRNLGVDERKVALVPNAVDLSEIDRKVPPIDFSVPRDSRVLLSVGRLESNKGFSYLARALSQVRKTPKNFVWLLAGEGPDREKLEEEIESQGLASHARLLGRVGDDTLHALYERCDLFVHPTLYEGSSMVTLEAMAHRKAVVATRVGGIPDKIADGENGLLVPPGDAGALAEAVSEALRVPERLAAWGSRSRAVVEERFDWSRRAAELLHLYEEILRGRNG